LRVYPSIPDNNPREINDSMNDRNKVIYQEGESDKVEIHTKNELPIKIWKEELSSIENSLIQNELGVVCTKSRDLFEKISSTISERWDIGLSSLGFSKRFFSNLRLVSPSLSPLFNKYLTFFPNNEIRSLNTTDSVKIIYLFHEILRSIRSRHHYSSGLKTEPCNIEKRDPPDPNVLKNGENQDKTAKNPILPAGRIYEKHEIWNMLRRAVLRYSNRS
jgi:hypothetical protein